MHRAALCLRSCRYLGFDRILYNKDFRGLSSVSANSHIEDDGDKIETELTWEDYHARTVGRRSVNAQNVVVDDLPATLEAHRASNRASVIRKTEAPSDMPELFFRPTIDAQDSEELRGKQKVAKESASPQDISKSHGDDSGSEQTEEDSLAAREIWPADASQVLEEYGRKGRKRPRRKAGVGFGRSKGILEYTAVPFPPKGSWAVGANSIPIFRRPWLAYMAQSNGNDLETLSGEIRAYEAYMRLTPAEEAAARLVLSDIRSITCRNLRQAPLTVLGSRSTGLATPLSDFDLNFSIVPADHDLVEDKPNRLSRQLIKQAVGSLRKVEKDMRYSIKLHETKLVLATVPIIETKHRATGLRVQIQTMAPYRPAQEYSAAYLNELPSVRPLFVVLRYCLEVRGLTTVYEGGLGSYTLLMMIVNALKHSSGIFASDDLAGQLLYILYFYGSADLYRFGYSANPPRVFDKLRDKWSLQERAARSKDPQLHGIDEIVRKRNLRKPYLLSLQDPANDSNDLGKNSYAIKHIQAVFNCARLSILGAMKAKATRPEEHEDHGIWSYLDPVVGADYQAFETHRSKVERFVTHPVRKDYDCSAERITEDFQERLKVHKGLTTTDEYGGLVSHPTPRPEPLEALGLRIRRYVGGPDLDKIKSSMSNLEAYLCGPSQINVRRLWAGWYAIKSRLARIAMLSGEPPEIRKVHVEYQERLPTSAVIFAGRFRKLELETRTLHKKLRSLALGVARPGRVLPRDRSSRSPSNRGIRITKSVKKRRNDPNVRIARGFLIRWYEMLCRKLNDHRRDFIKIRGSIVSLNKKAYKRLHRTENESKQRDSTTGPLTSLDGQGSSVSNRAKILAEIRRQLLARIEQIHVERTDNREEISVLRELSTRKGAHTEGCTAIARLEAANRLEQELLAERNKLEAACSKIRSSNRSRILRETELKKQVSKKERNNIEAACARIRSSNRSRTLRKTELKKHVNKKAAESVRPQTMSGDEKLAAVADHQVEAVVEKASATPMLENDKATSTTPTVKENDSKSRRSQRTRAQSRIDLFRTMLAANAVLKPRP